MLAVSDLMHMYMYVVTLCTLVCESLAFICAMKSWLHLG